MMSVIRYENIPVSMPRNNVNILDFAPALWLDAADSSTLFDSVVGGNLVGSGGTVARWQDKSGNNRHVTQSTAANCPTRVVGSQNGKDVLNFDGSDDNLTIANSFLNNLSGLTVFVVNKWSLNTSGKGAVFSYGAVGVNNTDILYSQGFPESTTRFAQVNSGADGSATFASSAPSSYIIETFAFNGSAAGNSNKLKIFENSSAKTLSSYTVPDKTASPTSPTFMVGGYFSFPSNYYYKGQIAEIIILPYAASDLQREAIERYLSNKWGISVAATIVPDFIAPANSVSISHGAKISAYRTLAPNTLPDMRVGGNTDTKITIAFPLCNKFANNDSFSDSYNFGSGVFANLTGTDSADITIGGRTFSGCYLDNLSVEIVPFQAATMSTSFTCTNPPTGLTMLSGLSKGETGMTNKFAYGHFATISGADNYSSNIHASISFSLDLKRTYSYAISKRNAYNVFLDEASKQLQIKATNIKTFINESGALSSFSVDLKNELGELILPSGTLSTSTRGRLSAQNLTSSPPNILVADVTIDEPLL